MSAAAVSLAGLSSAMRACLGTAPAASELRGLARREPGLSGLYHGATLAALARKGLASAEWDAALNAHEYRLTADGLSARAVLRSRVNEKLAALGWTRHEDSVYWTRAGLPAAITRGAAMRETEVKW